MALCVEEKYSILGCYRQYRFSPQFQALTQNSEASSALLANLCCENTFPIAPAQANVIHCIPFL
jgi:hypothetical protein